MIGTVLEVRRVRGSEGVNPGSRTFPDGDRRGTMTSAGECQVKVRQAGGLESAASVGEKSPLRSRQSMAVSR
jgi:hypothetical protein